MKKLLTYLLKDYNIKFKIKNESEKKMPIHKKHNIEIFNFKNL
jgi:hypothetical protein